MDPCMLYWKKKSCNRNKDMSSKKKFLIRIKGSCWILSVKFQGHSRSFQEPGIEFSRSLYKKISMPYIVLQCFPCWKSLPWYSLPHCKLNAALMGILIFGFNVSLQCNAAYRGHQTNFHIWQLRVNTSTQQPMQRCSTDNCENFTRKGDCQSNSHTLIGL